MEQHANTFLSTPPCPQRKLLRKVEDNQAKKEYNHVLLTLQA